VAEGKTREHKKRPPIRNHKGVPSTATVATVAAPAVSAKRKLRGLPEAPFELQARVF